MASAIRCEEAVERLWRFLDGALDTTDRAEVERHLALCLRCCGELEFARELQSKLAATTGPTMPQDARARLERLITDLAPPARPTDRPNPDRRTGGSM